MRPVLRIQQALSRTPLFLSSSPCAASFRPSLTPSPWRYEPGRMARDEGTIHSRSLCPWLSHQRSGMAWHGREGKLRHGDTATRQWRMLVRGRGCRGRVSGGIDPSSHASPCLLALHTTADVARHIEQASPSLDPRLDTYNHHDEALDCRCRDCPGRHDRLCLDDQHAGECGFSRVFQHTVTSPQPRWRCRRSSLARGRCCSRGGARCRRAEEREVVDNGSEG